jgi:hypothetical protein
MAKDRPFGMVKTVSDITMSNPQPKNGSETI